MRVRDVGRVELGAETYSANLRFIGLEAGGMGIQLLPSANALAVYQGVMAEMARLEKAFPPGLEWRLAFDNVSVVRESIKEVLITLVEAIVLVILVMFLFLQNWRSTLIPAITIPVSLIGTFAFVKLFDFSINTLTLFGIVLATGIVVDDAIVVIENIERHMARGEEELLPRRHRRHARGVRGGGGHRPRAGGGVRAGGLLPRHHWPPLPAVLADHRLRGDPVRLQRGHLHPRPLRAAPGQGEPRPRPLLHRGEPGHRRGHRGYVRLLEGRPRAPRPSCSASSCSASLATGWLFTAVPSAFVPDEDEGYFITVIQAPAGASLEYTTAIAKQAEAILFKDPDIRAAFSVSGFSFTRRRPQQRPHLHAAQGLRTSGAGETIPWRPCSTACAGP